MSFLKNLTKVVGKVDPLAKKISKVDPVTKALVGGGATRKVVGSPGGLGGGARPIGASALGHSTGTLGTKQPYSYVEPNPTGGAGARSGVGRLQQFNQGVRKRPRI